MEIIMDSDFKATNDQDWTTSAHGPAADALRRAAEKDHAATVRYLLEKNVDVGVNKGQGRKTR
jgi:hypothetical protein